MLSLPERSGQLTLRYLRRGITKHRSPVLRSLIGLQFYKNIRLSDTWPLQRRNISRRLAFAWTKLESSRAIARTISRTGRGRFQEATVTSSTAVRSRFTERTSAWFLARLHARCRASSRPTARTRKQITRALGHGVTSRGRAGVIPADVSLVDGPRRVGRPSSRSHPSTRMRRATRDGGGSCRALGPLQNGVIG